jgi:hypothetical protein
LSQGTAGTSAKAGFAKGNKEKTGHTMANHFSNTILVKI